MLLDLIGPDDLRTHPQMSEVSFSFATTGTNHRQPWFFFMQGPGSDNQHTKTADNLQLKKTLKK